MIVTLLTYVLYVCVHPVWDYAFMKLFACVCRICMNTSASPQQREGVAWQGLLKASTESFQTVRWVSRPPQAGFGGCKQQVLHYWVPPRVISVLASKGSVYVTCRRRGQLYHLGLPKGKLRRRGPNNARGGPQRGVPSVFVPPGPNPCTAGDHPLHYWAPPPRPHSLNPKGAGPKHDARTGSQPRFGPAPPGDQTAPLYAPTCGMCLYAC